jgi:hypothetical protein
MIEELSSVALNRAFPEHGLATGDIGTVVLRYPDGEAFEVEFVTGEGRTLAVLTLGAGDVRELGEGEILHARAITNR